MSAAKLNLNLMAIIFSQKAQAVQISREVKAGRMRKLASKIYTDDLVSPAEDLIRRHRLEIAAHFYPGAILSHRTALENSDVSPGGKLHLTVARQMKPLRRLPALEIRLWQGPPPRPDDTRTPVGEGKALFTSSQARAVLENLQIARTRGAD